MAYFDSSTVNLNEEQIKYRHYDEDGNEYFEVDKILDKKYDSKERRHKYKVMWKGWPNEEDQTWEPYENLEHVRDIVDEFEKQWKEKSKKKGGRGSKALHNNRAEEKPQPEPEEKEQHEQEIDIKIQEDKKSTPVKETEPEPVPTPTKKETGVKKGKTKASKANNAQPATNILKDMKSGSTENEPPLGEAYSVPIKKKVKTIEEEDTVDPRIRRKEPASNVTPPKTDVRDNTSTGFTFGKPDSNFKPTLSLFTSSEEIPMIQKRPSQEKTSRFSDTPTMGSKVVGQVPAPVTADKRTNSMAIEEPPKRGGVPDITAPKMSLLESIVNREQENVVPVVGSKPEPPGVKPNPPPEKEAPALNRNKSIPDEAKYKPAPPNYNPYNSLPTVSPTATTATTSPFGQMFKTQNEMVVEDVKLPGKVDRTKSMIEDIDRMMEDHEPEEVSLSKMDSVRSGRSDLQPPQGIQRHKSEQVETKKIQMQRKPSEIVIDDDDVDIVKKDTSSHGYGKKKERGHSKSRSRSRSPGHIKKKSKWNESPEGKDREKDKGKFKESRNHYEGGDKHSSHYDDKYGKAKAKEREKDREREKEREKEKEKDREREKQKEKEKEKERHKKDKDKVDHQNLKKSHEVSKHEVVDLLGKNEKVEKFEEVKIQKKRAVYKKTLYAKEQLMLDYEVDDRAYYKSIVNDYVGKKIDRKMFMEMLCPEGNFKDDEIQEIKAMSWEGKVTMNPEDYYFKVVWKPGSNGVQKGCRYASWQEFLEEKPKEAAEFVMSKLMAIVTKYGTFGEI